jgi:hypothetical protein
MVVKIGLEKEKEKETRKTDKVKKLFFPKMRIIQIQRD